MGSEIVGPRRVTFKSTSADVGFLAVPRYLHVCQRASLMKCSNAMLSNNSAGSPLLFELCTERVACTSNYRQRTSISSEATTWKKAIEKNKYLSSILLLVTSRVRKIHAVQTQNRTQAEGFFPNVSKWPEKWSTSVGWFGCISFFLGFPVRVQRP